MKKYIIILLAALLTPLSLWSQEEQEQQAQTVTVTGTVTDTKGEPMIGVSIVVRDVPGGVITDINGKYSIKMEPYQRLIFSYLGYDPVEVLVKEQRVVNVEMKESEASVLDEVVVTGLGSQKKLTVTGAVTNVDMEELKRFPTSNLSNALAGNVAGIIAMQTSGQPGRNTSEFWIRGISTFGANASALILVDGFERASIDELNIEDIESFTVLKDASATAIYGSKGANGVVLITTKRGKAGKVNVDVKVETSYNTRTITPEFEDGYTYAMLKNEALVTRNRGVYYQPEEIELIRTQMDPDFYPNVDWKDLLLKDGAWSYRANVNLSGGGNTARYYVSASYTEDEGMYNTDETLRKDYDTNANYKRWNYRLNVDMDITKTTLLKVGVGGSLEKQNSPGMGANDIWGALFGYNAVSTPVIYSNGYIPAVGTGGQTNPWVAATQTGYNQNWTNNLQTNVTLEQKLDFITKGLKFTGRFGYDMDNSNYINRRRWPEQWKALSRNQTTGEIVWNRVSTASDMYQESGSTGSRREFLEMLLDWNRSFGNHHPSVTLRYTRDNQVRTVDIGTDIKNGVNKRNQGLAGRVAYNWNYRYFLDFNFGYTGSENFAPGHQYGFFPAFSLAWNVAEEPFIKKNLPWLNMFKIRYSHGKVGNDNLGNIRFPYLYTISTGQTGYEWGFDTNGHFISGTRYTQVASTGITWEVAKKDDVGIDLSLFNDKFTATVDYFHEDRTGIFMSRAYLPAIVGLESQPQANVGEVKTRGFDGNFAYRQKIGEVDLTVRGNMTYYKNEIIERDEESQVYPYLYQKGYRVDQVKGLIAEGLFADYDDIRTSPKQSWGTVQPGDIKYRDVNGDGVVNDNDKVAIGATTRPSLIYGVGVSAAWRGFDVNVLFQGAGKSTYPIYGKCVFAFSENDWGQIFKGMLDDRYVDADTAAKLGIPANENPNASYPRLTYGANSNNQQTSTYWMRDGRYIRLKNLDIGYTLPKEFVNKLHMNNVRIYVTGTNLLTWSKFDMWDPETTNPRGEDYPLPKSVTVGLTVNL